MTAYKRIETLFHELECVHDRFRDIYDIMIKEMATEFREIHDFEKQLNREMFDKETFI